jgi:N-methylhydantoinase A
MEAAAKKSSPTTTGATPGYAIGIDVGGTFTDLVLVRPDRTVHLDKTATTPRDQSFGVLNGLRRLAKHEGISLRELLRRTERIVHGTTTADNTMIQMKGARTGLITSEGHRDEIELRRGFKESIWDPALPPPPPIARRRERYGIPERLDHMGRVVEKLDEKALRLALRRMKKQRIQSLAVVFLFSFLDGTHEKRVRQIAKRELPGVDISLSHEILPKAPEFERTSTTLVNAYVAPIIRKYLGSLCRKLKESGFRHDLLMIQSNGGLMTAAWVANRAVSVLGSGPAGGVIAACRIAEAAGAPDFVSVDMGGTSYDVCLVEGGEPKVESSWNWHHRYLVGMPMVDVHSVGAGGGSIAHVEAGALHVGPTSAGARPGPVCYGRGGTQPTVTDANLVLGYLNPKTFFGGELALDADAAHAAIDEQIRRPLGLKTIEEAAVGIFRLVNANMANAIHRVSASRGVDVRGLPLVAFGGNGAVHAGMQARELGIEKVLIPKSAPAFSALGLLLTDPKVIEMRSYIAPIDEASPTKIQKLFREMTVTASAALTSAGFAAGDLHTERVAYLCYPGQTFDMPVRVEAEGPIRRESIAQLAEAFHRKHEEVHTYASRDQMPILRGLSLEARASAAKPEVSRIAGSAKPAEKRESRPAFFAGRWRKTAIYDGNTLRARQRVEGPAIIEEPLTTIVVYPGQTARLDAGGVYHLTEKRTR